MKLNRVRRRRRDLLKIDRLTMLPNDVLLNILERVGTLDAIRTCVFSKRTQNLPAMLPQIVIVLDEDWKLHRDNRDMVKLTEKILSTRSPQLPIRKLKLRFIMRGDDHLRIGRSVALAMASQEIDVVEFDVRTKLRFIPGDGPDPLYFAKQFNGFIGECPDAFAGLTRLHLQNLSFGESDIPNILHTCKRLESLSFFRCNAGVGSVLHVQHPRLVELDIRLGRFLRVELNCLPKLQRISYNNWPYAVGDPLVLGFVPQLSELTLSCAYAADITVKLSNLLVNVPSIDNLLLNFQSHKIWIQPECHKLIAPLLGKLRLVNLVNLPEEQDIAWTMFFLEAASSLHELCITVWDHKCRRISQESHYVKTDVKWEPSFADFKHKNLAKLTIHGFQSDENFTRYVRRILKTAVNIKEVSLHDKKLCKLCPKKSDHPEVGSSRYPQSVDEEDSLRKKITEELVIASLAVIHFLPSCYYTPRESM